MRERPPRFGPAHFERVLPGRARLRRELLDVAGQAACARRVARCAAAARTPAEGAWRCRGRLCDACAEVERGVWRHRWYRPVLELARQIRLEHPELRAGEHGFMHVTLTTSAPRSSAELADLEWASQRVAIAQDAFARLRKRIAWFRDVRAFVLSGWHVSDGWPHLHLLVYGSKRVTKAEILAAWRASYREAYAATRAAWEAEGRAESVHARFMPEPRADNVSLTGKRESWSKRDVANRLGYLVDDGWDDARMGREPRLGAVILASWHRKTRLQRWGRARQHPLDYLPPEGDLRAAIDYPISSPDWQRFFSDGTNEARAEELCRRYLERVRWTRAFTCPRCGSAEAPWRRSGGGLRCRTCRHDTSATAGTALAGSPLPLWLWMRVVWKVADRPDVSAREIERLVGLRYETALSVLRRLRAAMRPRTRLPGPVVSDAYAVRFATGQAALVALAAPASAGAALRLRHVPDRRRATLHAFVQEAVASGATVRTHGAAGYRGLDRLGYVHERTALGRAGPVRRAWDARVEAVRAPLEAWFASVFRGAVTREHLQGYLNEYAFHSDAPKHRGLRFYRLIEHLVAAE